MEASKRARAIAEVAVEKRAENVVILDMRQFTPICDYFVICTGRSPVHVQAVAEAIMERLEELGVKVGHVEGLPEGRWVLLDYLTVVVHVFTEDARQYYALEELWADAPKEYVEDTAASVSG